VGSMSWLRISLVTAVIVLDDKVSGGRRPTV
jgi:hypothetical protein